MSTSFHRLPESLRTRLESVSMRLDASTDHLLQTRDLLIRHLEHQLLQIQEVRCSLHEVAGEVLLLEAQTHQSPALPAATVAPAPFQIEQLFAPLNAAMQPTHAVKPATLEPAPLPPPSTLAAPPPLEKLFDLTPLPQVENSAPANAGQVSGWSVPMGGNNPPAQSVKAQSLEDATLEELNEALTRAFAEIAGRGSRQ